MPCGLHLIEPNFKKLKKYINDGFNFIPYSTDTYILSQAIDKMFKKLDEHYSSNSSENGKLEISR